MANGLTPKEEKTLQHRLRQIDTMHAKRHQVGGIEQREMYRLQEAIKTRLDPPSTEDMDRDTAALFQSFETLPLYAEIIETK
jgi:hypothetical protein